MRLFHYFSSNNQGGFSLLEMLVVVTIVGILAGVSLPLYANYARRGFRADAQAALMEASVRMQKYFTTNNTFAGADNGDAFLNITTIPANAANPRYTLSISSLAAGSYTLQAAPGADQAVDECGTLSVLSNGQRTAAVNTCWQ